MRQRLDHRAVHRQHWVEEVRQADALGLGNQAEERPIAVKAPRPAQLHHLQPRLIVAVDQLVRHPSVRGLVGQLQRVRAKPGDADHRDQPVRQDPAHGRIEFEVF